MLQLAEKDLWFVPKGRYDVFNQRVINSYMEIAMVEAGIMPCEIAVSDELLEMLNRFASLDIFEDEHQYKQYEKDEEWMEQFESLAADEQNYSGFMHDLILVMDRNKLSFFIEHSNLYENMPTKGVW